MKRALLPVLAGVFALATFRWLEPGIAAADSRLDEARLRLRSDAIVLAARPHFIAERRRLLQRYGSVAEGGRESEVLRSIASASRRFGVEFVTSTVTAVAPPALSAPQRGPAPPEFDEVKLAVELRGSYRGLLLAIDDVARHLDLLRIDGASLRGSGRAIDASVPMTLLRLHRSGT